MCSPVAFAGSLPARCCLVTCRRLASSKEQEIPTSLKAHHSLATSRRYSLSPTIDGSSSNLRIINNLVRCLDFGPVLISSFQHSVNVWRIQQYNFFESSTTHYVFIAYRWELNSVPV